MTPKEVQGRLTAHAKQEEQRISRLDYLDALAWMIGVYSARAFHDPKHYPKKANLVETKQSAQSVQYDMDEESMKTILTGYAEIHNTIEEAKR
jgi:hypothetical protein